MSVGVGSRSSYVVHDVFSGQMYPRFASKNRRKMIPEISAMLVIEYSLCTVSWLTKFIMLADDIKLHFARNFRKLAGRPAHNLQRHTPHVS